MARIGKGKGTGLSGWEGGLDPEGAGGGEGRESWTLQVLVVGDDGGKEAYYFVEIPSLKM